VANSKQALKRVRQNERRTERNRIVRSKIRTFTNKFDEAIEAKQVAEAEAAYKEVVGIMDRAAKSNVVPRERASRKAGRMAKRLNSIRG
jgi:small subunit ribosomal protein S20